MCQEINKYGNGPGLDDTESVVLLARGNVRQGPRRLKHNLLLHIRGSVELAGEQLDEARDHAAVNDLLDRRIVLLGQMLPEARDALQDDTEIVRMNTTGHRLDILHTALKAIITLSEEETGEMGMDGCRGSALMCGFSTMLRRLLSESSRAFCRSITEVSSRRRRSSSCVSPRNL